jgi:hypothetical protein
MLFRRKRQTWLGPTVLWLVACTFLYRFSRMFLRAAVKMNEWPPLRIPKEKKKRDW